MRKKLLNQMHDLKIEVVDKCQICQGLGFIDSKECQCRVVQRYLDYLIEAKIPTEFWELSLESLTEVRPVQLLKVAEKYISRIHVAVRKSLGIMFMGPNGRGKTAIQCAIGKAAVVSGLEVQYFTVQQYIDAVKSNDSELLEEYSSGKVILLDELDKVYISQKTNFVPKTLEEFIRRMISSGVAFIICTNLVEADLIKLFGESTLSMLRGHLKFLLMDGEDYRDTQNEDWLNRLETDIDFSNPHIIKSAYELYDRELREDSVDWEKEY